MEIHVGSVFLWSLATSWIAPLLVGVVFGFLARSGGGLLVGIILGVLAGIGSCIFLVLSVLKVEYLLIGTGGGFSGYEARREAIIFAALLGAPIGGFVTFFSAAIVHAIRGGPDLK